LIGEDVDMILFGEKMPINKGEIFATQDVYVDYPFEEVMYRWDYKIERVYVKFYGQSERSESISHDNRLFNDALLFGDVISARKYKRGK
jgi:hypothetical protein